jgi:hypothetical protein
MSFMDEIGKLAEGFLGGATPQQAADAAADHVQSADPSATADHLTQSLGNFDPATLSNLGQQLLSSYTNHQSYPGDANSAQEAGVSQDAVAAGEPGALATMLQFAKNHPEVLQNAASAFMQKNPAAISQLVPGLLQGIMGKLGGGA